MAANGRDFKDPTTLTWLTKASLWAWLAILVWAFAATALRYRELIHAFPHGMPLMGPIAMVSPHLTFFGILALAVNGAIPLILAIVVFFWIYRAAVNARRLGAANLRHSPGWAVGWFFVPIANLGMPYRAMGEIWRASADPARWQEQRVPSLLRWWWFLGLFASIAALWGFKLSLD